jgi:hypothetical protein
MMWHARRYRRDTEGPVSYKSADRPESSLSMPRALLLAAIILLIGGQAGAQDRPASTEIGSWVLSCPDAQSVQCELRLSASIAQAGNNGPSASVEVVHRGNLFVPVVVLRGLSMQAAVGGVLAVQTDVALRFDAQPWIPLACALDGAAVFCVPAPAASAQAAAALPNAHGVLVRLRITLPDMMPLPEQSRSLDLQGTPEALARFRATAPASESVPVIAGLDWRGFLDRVARDAGFQNGLTDLLHSGERLFVGQRP